MVYSFRTAKGLIRCLSGSSSGFDAVKRIPTFCGRLDSTEGAGASISSFSTASSEAAAEPAELGKQVAKARVAIARKGKAEIFTKDLGKKPKIHLKPSLLSDRRSPVVNKDLGSSRAERRGVQKRLKANLVLDANAGALKAYREIDELEDDEYSPSKALDEVEDVCISVEAFFVARSVDLKGLAQETSMNVVPCRNHVVIKLDDPLNREEAFTPMPDCLSNDRLMVVFQYGSVVLFNFDQVSADDERLKVVLKHCKDSLSEPRKDNYRIMVKPDLERWSQGGADKIMVKKLDMDAIRIISLVLSQSTALDHYTRGIDGMLNTFGELNRKMELTGTFNMKRKALFKLVAAANTSLADAILRLGLLERSDVAWQSARYDRIWEHMREEFELDDRFESLEFKIGIIQHNVKFFLDILQNRKSDTLEWIIIVLIAAEICVGVYEITSGA